MNELSVVAPEVQPMRTNRSCTKKAERRRIRAPTLRDEMIGACRLSHRDSECLSRSPCNEIENVRRQRGECKLQTGRDTYLLVRLLLDTTSVPQNISNLYYHTYK